MKRGKRNHGNLPTRTRSLRLPVALWERLQAEATRTGDSMNGAVWRILDASLPLLEPETVVTITVDGEYW